jgi:lipopolysaccharide export system protein LptA
MKHSRTAFVGLLLGAGLAGFAEAEQADRNKPMHIEADRLRFDELKQVRVITGNVVITKGTIVIRGATVELRQDPAGYQYAKVTADAGRRAFFRQKREAADEFIEGEGQTIEYDGKADTVRLAGRAELRRLRGATLFDQMNGNLITYDNLTEVFNVDGVGNSTSAGDGGGRIRIMLTPAPAASRPGADAAPSGGTTLRSSPSLSREPK